MDAVSPMLPKQMRFQREPDSEEKMADVAAGGITALPLLLEQVTHTGNSKCSF